jgi:hypothetical protein
VRSLRLADFEDCHVGWSKYILEHLVLGEWSWSASSPMTGAVDMDFVQEVAIVPGKVGVQGGSLLSLGRVEAPG